MLTLTSRTLLSHIDRDVVHRVVSAFYFSALTTVIDDYKVVWYRECEGHPT
jgi:hypothetical protein